MKPLFILMIAFVCFSCKKGAEVASPDFSVSVETERYKAGDTVLFRFSGSTPDIVSFYSGEGASDYRYLSTDRIYKAATALSFSSAKYAGTNPDCAHLKYSTDFNGSYDIASIKQATWTDINDRFHIPDINGNSAIYEPSGEADISDLFISADKPAYFAWFFTTKANSGRTRFRVRQFTIRSLIGEDTTLSAVKYEFVDFAFKMVLGTAWETEVDPKPQVTSANIFWDGVYSNKSFKEGWAVSGPVYAAAEANIGTATAAGIKAMDVPLLQQYKHVYKTPGTYVATFVAKNVNIYDAKETVRQVKIVVE